jgi:3-deoxy-7-phosphoheptulonate synthase
MILVIRPDASLEQIDHVIERVRELGFTPHVSRGEARTIVGVIGDETKPGSDNFSAIAGVEQVLPIMKPFKLASREFHKGDSAVYVGKVKIGQGSLAMIAGPCAIEGYEVVDAIAKYVKAGGANILRGGAFKPRTSPYAFQGMGEDGLKILRDVGTKYDMPVVTEVMDPRQVDLVCRYADMLQIGARNMQNFDLLKECGKAMKPVLLKRGMSATVKDLLMSASTCCRREQGRSAGRARGAELRGQHAEHARHERGAEREGAEPPADHRRPEPRDRAPGPDPGDVPGERRGRRRRGHVEVHNCPEKALSDGPQALLPHQFLDLMGDLRKLSTALGREFWAPPEK